MTAYLLIEDVAEILGCSVRTMQERVRLNRCPHRRVGGTRRVLFIRDEVDAWIDGCELEVVTTANGGRVVRPVTT